MKKYVVDASVAIKWFIPEIHATAATRLWDNTIQLLVPDLIFAEVGNILWKKQRMQEITPTTALSILSDFKRLPIINYDILPLLHDAWQIAKEYSCSFYDSLYVALALREKSLLVTADQRLINNLVTAPWKQSLLFIEDINPQAFA